MATVRELITVWGFDVDNAPLKKMEGNVTALKRELRSTFLTVSAGAATMFGFAKFTADAGEAAVKGSAKLGLAVDEYQKWIHVVNLADMTQEDFRTGFLFMARNAADQSRKMSGEVGAAFRRLGVDPKAAKENYDAFFSDVLAGLNGIQDVGERASITRAIFGRGGDGFIDVAKMSREEIAALKQEAVDIGYVMSTEDAEAAERFNDNLKRLTDTGKGLRNVLGNALIPEMDNLVKATMKWAVQNRVAIKTNLEGFAKGVTGAARAAAPVLLGIGKGAMWVVNALGGIERVTKVALLGFLSWKAIGIGTWLFATARNAFLAVQAFLKIGWVMKTLQIAGTVLRFIFTKLGFAIMLAVAWIQDFYTFFRGGDSAFGRIINSFKYIVSDLSATLKTLMEIAARIPGITPIMKAAARFGIGEKGNATQTWGSTMVANSEPWKNRSTSTTSVQAPITVQVPAGTPPEAVGGYVQKGVGDALDRVLRETGRDLRPVEAF